MIENLNKTIVVSVEDSAIIKCRVSISDDSKVVYVSQIMKYHPKNRKDKETMKRISSYTKKVDRKTYLVTTSCVLNTSLLSRIMKCVVKADGNLWFDLLRFKND